MNIPVNDPTPADIDNIQAMYPLLSLNSLTNCSNMIPNEYDIPEAMLTSIRVTH